MGLRESTRGAPTNPTRSRPAICSGGCVRGNGWAADQVRFTGAWVRGGAGRQAVVLAHAVTAPRTSWRIMRTPATDAPVPVPVRDPDWVAHRTHRHKGATA
ncbi:hypothetical protein [Streptomyces lateritius]|uniref:hypothetical protein n=1 Tax=Streptomyces lateritius TaxID=67313 RepID=UPI001C8BC41E|nr:hypothetical protein [Streptomyces lateritius]MBX9420828.1 hypothetical protein [Streptomyces lateritius]